MTDPNSLTTESAATLNNRLLQRYTEAVDAETLRQFAADKRLSGLFIPAVSESYTRSKARLLIVGRETAGWRSHIDVSVSPDSANVAHYLQRQMLYHTEKVHNVSATSKFFQFYRHAARTVPHLKIGHRRTHLYGQTFFASMQIKLARIMAPGRSQPRLSRCRLNCYASRSTC